MKTNNEHTNILYIAQRVIDDEIEGLERLREQINCPEFYKLVDRCKAVVNSGGKIVLTGVGKSGLIAQKIAATLTSTGSPAIFMDTMNSIHGDLGIINKKDVVLAISYSGKTKELLNVIPAIAKLHPKAIIAITGDLRSPLALSLDVAFAVPMKVSREACPFNLAPTVSTTALLALGDALAITLMKLNDFTQEQYAIYHPGGAIGKALETRLRPDYS